MRWLTASSCRISAEPSPFSRTNTAIGTPQARWREITQSGRPAIMPLMRFWPDGGTHWVTEIACSARARRVSPGFALPSVGDVLVHRDEPLRRVAEDHRLLRAPGMRILMLEPAARQQHAGIDQRLDHGLVGVALFALVVDDAFSGEARRMIGEGAVLVDGVGDRGVDAARFERARIRHPDIEVLAAVAGCGVDEAGAGVVGDVIAFEQRHAKFVTAGKALKRMRAFHGRERGRRHVADPLIAGHARLLEHRFGERVGQDQEIAGLRPVVRRRVGDAIKAVGNLRARS